MRRIRIVSDGTRRGTDVTDADTGERIEGVIRVEVDLDGASGHAVARLTIEGPIVDLTSAITDVEVIL